MRRFICAGLLSVIILGTGHVSSAEAPEVKRPTTSFVEQYDRVYVAPAIAVTHDVKAYSSVPSDKTKRCPEFEPLFREYGLEPVEVFSYIAWRESGCNPKAVNARFDKAGKVIWTLNKNGSIDRGLLQVNSCWKTVVRQTCATDLNGLFDLPCQLKVAKRILTETQSGLGNWNIYP